MPGAKPRESLSPACDREATAAANRERGIDLRIPHEANELAIGFGQ